MREVYTGSLGSYVFDEPFWYNQVACRVSCLGSHIEESLYEVLVVNDEERQDTEWNSGCIGDTAEEKYV